jgi:hypothetical protein
MTILGFVITGSTIAIIALSIAVIVLGGLVLHLSYKLKSFLVGIDSKNILESMMHLRKSHDDMSAFRNELETYLKTVEKRLQRSVQAVHTVRFNPFKGTGSGGNQSFATAFLTEDGNGVVISSLYSREHVSVFSKPVAKHNSEFDLSDEERGALEEAKKKVKGV